MTFDCRRFSTLVMGCVVLALALASSAEAQRGRGGTPPDMPGSPSVSPDGRVTFSLYAPDASEVTIVGDWMTVREPQAFIRSNEGLWATTVGPLPADFYSYTLFVDGVRTLDPRNPMIKQGNASVDNMFLLPGDRVAYAERQRVPHGDIRRVWYESSTFLTERRLHVYTPPGYDRARETDYPVLYLLHGGGDEDSGWSTIGRAGFILDNLLAAGQAHPMLVVMPNGSLPPGGDFTSELMNDIIPFVEAHYRVWPAPSGRALAGLSMGGLQTTNVLTHHPHQFAHVAIWSAGLFNQSVEEFVSENAEFLDGADGINETLRLLSVVVGEDDFARPGSETLSGVFEEYGIRHEFVLTGGGHTWMNWRSYLRDLAPRLFR